MNAVLLSDLFNLVVLCGLGWMLGRAHRLLRIAWREELQLIEWLEELGWTVERKDGFLFLVGTDPDPEEARLARERGR